MLGARIGELRLKNGIPLEGLAEKSGISADALARIERGELPQLDTQRLLKIADNLRLKSGADFAGLLQLNKYPRRFHAYCVGLPKSGTVSLAGLFSNYRSCHEFHQWETHQMIIRRNHGGHSRERFRGFLKERSHLNKAKYTVNVLRNLDRDFLKVKFGEHCSSLMERFFPGFSLDNFLA